MLGHGTKIKSVGFVFKPMTWMRDAGMRVYGLELNKLEVSFLCCGVINTIIMMFSELFVYIFYKFIWSLWQYFSRIPGLESFASEIRPFQSGNCLILFLYFRFCHFFWLFSHRSLFRSFSKWNRLFWKLSSFRSRGLPSTTRIYDFFIRMQLGRPRDPGKRIVVHETRLCVSLGRQA
jgi:hypothetical protein